ncbi:MAG: DMT family transporter [Chloroflexi bacterium]|nr:DMT family transporter [Chloroflexota bacterium]
MKLVKSGLFSNLPLQFSTLRAALPRQLKGVVLLFASAACTSVTFIASKQAMLELSPLGFTCIWFAVASVWGINFYLFRYGPKWPSGLRASIGPLLLLGFLNGLSNYLFFTSIDLGDPTLVAFFSRMMMSMLGLAGLVAGQLAWPGLTTWLWIIGGAFFGPFLSYFLFYKSLHYLDMSKGAVIRATQPLFVAVYSLILFGAIISSQQFLGGLVMIAGVTLMLWERK